MAIEVRQMLVKSTVLQRQDLEARTSNDVTSHALNEIKEDILAECKQLVIDVLRMEQER